MNGWPPTSHGMRLLLLTVLLVGAFGVGCTTPKDDAPAVASQKTLYVCPMHPHIQQDHPGKCPLCGMELQPQTAVPAPMPVPSMPSMPSTTAGSIQLEPELQRRVGMATALVETRPLSDVLRATGEVVSDERGDRMVSARAMGRIERLFVNRTGQKVKPGQPLLEMYSPMVLNTQQEYLLAQKSALAAEPGMGESLQHTSSATAETANAGSPMAHSALRRLALFGMTPTQLAALERTREISPTLTVVSPASGTVVEKLVLEGAYVQEGAPLYRLQDLSKVWALVRINERDIGRVKVGNRVTIGASAFPGRTWTGTVDYLYPGLDARSRAVTVRVPLENPDEHSEENSGGRLLPGMSVDATVALETHSALTVPAAAIVRTGTDPIVFIVESEGVFKPRVVKTGVEDGGFVQILSGLQAGERVVSTGAFLIDAQSQITGGQSALWSGAREVAPVPSDPSSGSAPGSVPLPGAKPSAAGATPSGAPTTPADMRERAP